MGLISCKTGSITLPTIADTCMEEPAIARLLLSTGTLASEKRVAGLLDHLMHVQKRGSSRFNSQSATFEEFCSLMNCVRSVDANSVHKLRGKTQRAPLCEEYLAFIDRQVAKRDPGLVQSQKSSVATKARLPEKFTDLKLYANGVLIDDRGKLLRASQGNLLRKDEMVCNFDDTVMFNPEGHAISRSDLSFEGDVLMCGERAVMTPDNQTLTKERLRIGIDLLPKLDSDNKIWNDLDRIIAVEEGSGAACPETNMTC